MDNHETLYEVYMDDNYDKEGNSQALIGCYSSLDEAIRICKEIIKESLEKYPLDYCAQEVYRNWCFGGVTAFVKGDFSFSPKEYAQEIACSKYHSFDKES